MLLSSRYGQCRTVQSYLVRSILVALGDLATILILCEFTLQPKHHTLRDGGLDIREVVVVTSYLRIAG